MMDRTETRKAAEIMLAYADGVEVECKDKGSKWHGGRSCGVWDWNNYEYRIKPQEPREFKIMVMGNGKIRDLNDMSGGFLGEVIKVREVLSE